MNEKLKERVGKEVAKFVENNMVVGLGTGSTIFYTIKELGARLNSGLNFQAICTSKDTEKKAREVGIKIVDLNDIEKINIAIDGADEVDKNLNLMKGGGGALTREKIIDYRAEKFYVVVDQSKQKEILGGFPLPVEVMKFCWKPIKNDLEKLGAKVILRGRETPFVTDNGNFILDTKFDKILKPAHLEEIINNIPGVVENGIFRNGKITEVLVGTNNGIEILK